MNRKHYIIWSHGVEYPINVDADTAIVNSAHFGERHIILQRGGEVVAEIFHAVAWECRGEINPAKETSEDLCDDKPRSLSPHRENVPYTIPHPVALEGVTSHSL